MFYNIFFLVIIHKNTYTFANHFDEFYNSNKCVR